MHGQCHADLRGHLLRLSQRLWYLVLPEPEFLPNAVRKHIELVEAIRAGEADRAGALMHDNVQGFYDQVRAVLSGEG